MVPRQITSFSPNSLIEFYDKIIQHGLYYTYVFIVYFIQPCWLSKLTSVLILKVPYCLSWIEMLYHSVPYNQFCAAEFKTMKQDPNPDLLFGSYRLHKINICGDLQRWIQPCLLKGIVIYTHNRHFFLCEKLLFYP